MSVVISNHYKNKIESYVHDVINGGKKYKFRKFDIIRYMENDKKSIFSKMSTLDFINYLQKEKIINIDTKTIDIFNSIINNRFGSKIKNRYYYNFKEYVSINYSDVLKNIEINIKNCYYKKFSFYNKSNRYRLEKFKNRFLNRYFGNVDDVVKFKYLRDLGLIDVTDDELINSISRNHLILNTKYVDIDPKFFIFMNPNNYTSAFSLIKNLFKGYSVYLSIQGDNNIIYSNHIIIIRINNIILNKKDLKLFINNDFLDFLKTEYPEICKSITPKAFKFELEYLYQNISKHSKYLGYWKGDI